MGELLRETERAKGGNVETLKQYPTGTIRAPVGPQVIGDVRVPMKDAERPTLADLGLTKKESAKAQMLAQLPDETFHEIKAGKETIVVRSPEDTAQTATLADLGLTKRERAKGAAGIGPIALPQGYDNPNAPTLKDLGLSEVVAKRTHHAVTTWHCVTTRPPSHTTDGTTLFDVQPMSRHKYSANCTNTVAYSEGRADSLRGSVGRAIYGALLLGCHSESFRGNGTQIIRI